VTTHPEFDSLVPAQSFDRRSFIATSLGAGFALAVQPALAQTAIRTDAAGLLAGEVRVPVKDRPEQLSYVLKFTTYHRPRKQTGAGKSPAIYLIPSSSNS